MTGENVRVDHVKDRGRRFAVSLAIICFGHNHINQVFF